MEFHGDRIDLKSVNFTPELLRCISAELARKFRVIPVLESSGRLTIALTDPSDLEAIDSLAHSLNREIQVCIADESQLGIFIQRFYGDDKAAA